MSMIIDNGLGLVLERELPTVLFMVLIVLVVLVLLTYGAPELEQVYASPL
jgi:hypothetical protein